MSRTAAQRSGSDGSLPAGLELVPARPFVDDRLVVRIGLAAGDRALVSPGDTVVAGSPLAEHVRDAHVQELGPDARVDARRPGERWAGAPGEGRPGNGERIASGELLFELDGRWRIATGEHVEVVEAPADGIVRDVRPGIAIEIETAWLAVRGLFAIGGPSRGRLEVATEPGGELRAGALDVGRSGTVLVVGSRIDAEALTRARAMGVRGVLVATLPGKDQRDFAASEARQQAALHGLPPFAVVVLDGVLRRPIPGPIASLLEHLGGQTVGLAADPPALLFAGPRPAAPPVDWVRVRHGPAAGREGRWLGPAGPRRFAAGAHLEAGLVRLDDGETLALPVADLERFG